jgi:bifunctional DNA-binding transcriptional regulator/antitoxin component of YhaV-PrlF toxin-antitoxin module
MESYTVAERDRFGNAGRVIPAEIRREFGIASTQSFSVRFNTYSPN